jgi:serine O-acetyltransferase
MPLNHLLWEDIQNATVQQAADEPILASFLHTTILNHSTLGEALSYHLSSKLESPAASAMLIRDVIKQALDSEPSILEAVAADLIAIKKRDSACSNLATPFLFFKGFHALQVHRVAHWLWINNRRELALFLQNRSSVIFAVDIHPAAQIGKGIMLDHATGIVIGETAIVEDNVSLMQSVTLGGTGKDIGDRHPKVRAGVMIGPGSKILGNIEIGTGAKVCSGSVVLKSVKAHTTVAGVPALEVGHPDCQQPALDMNQNI